MSTTTIKRICKIINGSTPSTVNVEFWDGDIPWLTPKDLSGYSHRYIKNGERFITEKGYNSCSTSMVPKNSVLLTSRAPIGYLAIAEQSLCTNQGFKSLICNENTVKPLYMYYWLSQKIDYLKAISTGATFKELSKDLLERVEISLPSLQYQQYIVDIIEY